MKKITYFCMLSLLFTLVFTGCNKETYPNPNYMTEEYKSGLHYVEILLEDYGSLYVVLDADAAPATVTNFLRLTEEGFYDGLTFHRVIDDFMIQGGDPEANGTGGSVYTLPGEFALNGYENPISHVRGTLSMARAEDYDSASSQFFIVQTDSTALDGKYAAFGTVVSGMEYVDSICNDASVSDDNGLVALEYQPVIKSVTILTEGEFKFLEQHNFKLPEESDDSEVTMELTMELTNAEHGKEVAATWTVSENAEHYLFSSNVNLAKVSLYYIDLTTMEYDKENPLASFENLAAGQLIDVQLMVPEGLPCNIFLVEKENGAAIRYLVSYDGRSGGATLSPLDDPTN